MEVRRAHQLTLALGLMLLCPAVLSASDSSHALIRAIRVGDVELLESLLRQGAPPNLRLSDGTTPLMIAARDGTADAVDLLLRYGADPEIGQRSRSDGACVGGG